MAKRSPAVTASWKYLRKEVATIQNEVTRKAVLDAIENPAPTLLKRLADPGARAAAHQDLTAKELLKERGESDFLPERGSDSASLHPFWVAPGSGYQSHHSYPGGLATHTALNLRVSLALYEGYKGVYGYGFDRDVVIASQTLHDLLKPWVFQWGDSGESRTEKPMAGTGEHHPLSIAESIVRQLPPAVCVAQACAHDHPGTPDDEAKAVKYLRAAAILAGVDPVRAGLLAPDGQTLPLPRRSEPFVCHLGDHDYVLTVPMAKWTIALLGELATEKYGMSSGDLKGKPFNAFRNYVFSQATIEALYGLHSAKGRPAFAQKVATLVKPV
jgi:hypothetical protein